MFNKSNNTVVSSNLLVNYIDNVDVYNSKLLYKLSNPVIEKIPFEITVHEYRPDLIAQDFYGSIEYLPYVLISSGMSLEQLKKGVVIKLIPKTTLDRIIKSL